jgi:hypothetical protein
MLRPARIAFFAIIMASSRWALLAQGTTIGERFEPPRGFERVRNAAGSFAEYLRDLPLKEPGSPVLLYDGSKKRSGIHAAVVDMPFLDRDLIQCADAVMKLRAEYLFSRGESERISFTITNGMRVPFSEYAKGMTVKVAGAKTEWVDSGAGPSRSRKRFDSYLVFIYAYAGTVSLARDLAAQPISSLKAGDVFIQGGSPGHAVIVVDVVVERNSGRKAMLLAQSYMPSQEIHVLKNPAGASPWYEVEDAVLKTPEWTFPRGSLRRFKD